MSEIDELILASRALAHAASQVISLEEVPSRIVHEFYQAVRVQQEASKARADSALDRASIPAMFNVVGDELAKLTRVNELILDRLRVLSAQGSVNCEKIDSIEAQLAALRAEADKGRERVTDSLDLVGAEEFTQIKCLLDLTNKRLKALELRDARGKKKQERKRPARKNR